jgi:hypothetical protein
MVLNFTGCKSCVAFVLRSHITVGKVARAMQNPCAIEIVLIEPVLSFWLHWIETYLQVMLLIVFFFGPIWKGVKVLIRVFICCVLHFFNASCLHKKIRKRKKVLPILARCSVKDACGHLMPSVRSTVSPIHNHKNTKQNTPPQTKNTNK